MFYRLFFFNDTATTEIYTLSLHDALPICIRQARVALGGVGTKPWRVPRVEAALAGAGLDRKSTRLNSSHANISYAVFCLKKKNNQNRYDCNSRAKHIHHDTLHEAHMSC